MRKIMWAAVSITIFQSLLPVYAAEQVAIMNVETGKREIINFSYNQTWKQLEDEASKVFGEPGTLDYYQKKVGPNDVIRTLPEDIAKMNSIHFKPSSKKQATLLSSKALKEQAEKLFATGSESDANKGTLLLTFSDINDAIEKKDWAAARRKFDRLEDKTKSDPIAQAIKVEIDRSGK